MGLIPGSGRSPGEGNGNPLQYSCLGNPMDEGAWRATAHGVTNSWPGLSAWTTHSKVSIVPPVVNDNRTSPGQLGIWEKAYLIMLPSRVSIGINFLEKCSSVGFKNVQFVCALWAPTFFSVSLKQHKNFTSNNSFGDDCKFHKDILLSCSSQCG